MLILLHQDDTMDMEKVALVHLESSVRLRQLDSSPFHRDLGLLDIHWTHFGSGGCTIRCNPMVHFGE